LTAFFLFRKKNQIIINYFRKFSNLENILIQKNMPLQEEFEEQGQWLFKYRGIYRFLYLL
jgi:hypothetical protein